MTDGINVRLASFKILIIRLRHVNRASVVITVNEARILPNTSQTYNRGKSQSFCSMRFSSSNPILKVTHILDKYEMKESSAHFIKKQFISHESLQLYKIQFYLKSSVFWNEMLFSPVEIYEHFEGIHCLHL